MHLLPLRGQDVQLRSLVLKSLGECLTMLMINPSLLVLPRMVSPLSDVSTRHILAMSIGAHGGTVG